MENILFFRKMGMDIKEEDNSKIGRYTGDIGNYRIRGAFEYNEVEFLVEAHTDKIERKKALNSDRELKNPILVNDRNGMLIEIYVRYTEVIQNCNGGWMTHKAEKCIYREAFNEYRHNENYSYHTKDKLLRIVNMITKANFDELRIIK